MGEFLAKNKASAAAYFTDEIDALLLLMERCCETAATPPRFTELEFLVNSLFADDISPRGLVTLSSVHKAKGREWPRVFILGAGDYMPFFLANQDWEQEQERNLIYVAITRAEHHLIYVEGVKAWLDAKAKEPR